MTTRRRALVALLLQLPFAFSVVQGVWASTCLPGMPMDMGAAAAEEGAVVSDQMSGMTDMGDMSAMADMSAPAGKPDHDGPSSTPSDCMLALFGATGSCAVGTAIRPVQIDELVSPPEDAFSIVAGDQPTGALWASGLFRPPRQ